MCTLNVLRRKSRSQTNSNSSRILDACLVRPNLTKKKEEKKSLDQVKIKGRLVVVTEEEIE